MNQAHSVLPLSRSQRLKAATAGTHGALDKRILAADIFASHEAFAGFLRVQYRFHRDIDALYVNRELQALLPELGERRRLPKIANDLAALRSPLPVQTAGALDACASLPVALGWLYVAEGSNLGGTILFKIASEKLGLQRDFGASHLAAHPDGAARHWRQFTAALDAVELSTQQEDEVVQGAEQAFRSVRSYVDDELQVLAG